MPRLHAMRRGGGRSAAPQEAMFVDLLGLAALAGSLLRCPPVSSKDPCQYGDDLGEPGEE